MTHREPAGPAVHPAEAAAGISALLPSDLATISLGIWTAGRLYAPGTFTRVLTVGAAVIWILAACAPRRSTPFRRLAARCLGLGAIVMLAHFQGSPAPGWATATSLGIMLAAALTVIGRMLRWASGGRPMGWSDGWRGAALQVVAAYAVQPFVVGAHVGSGDSYHYSLMLSDSLAQIHSRIFPLLVGQSPYAFNGNIHTLRTAPFFEYLGASLDLISLHTLPIFGLQGLILLISAVLGALGAYAALRRYAPGKPWEAAALGCLYLLSPGILVPLYEGDMIATFLTIAFMPWLVLGVANATDEPGRWSPWAVQAAALAALWWSHPPIAFWSSLLVFGAWLLILLRGGWSWRILLRMSVAGVVFACLAGYVFVSVASLGLRAPHVTAPEQVAAILRSIAASWRPSLLPITGSDLEGDLQLGYPLMGCVLLGFIAVRARRSAAMLLAGVGAFLVLLWPIPAVTARLWSWAPSPVLTVTNGWPMQRFYVILSALAVFAAMAGISRIARGRAIATASLGAAMAIGLAWSASQAHELILIARRGTMTRDLSENSHRLENVVLTKSSYLIFNVIPAYFSDGVMSPILETRLLDLKTFDVIADGATTLPGGNAPPIASFDLKRHEGTSELGATVQLAPGHTSLLRFDFLGRQPAGALSLIGPVLAREYRLPSSGLAKSFGSGPENSRTIAIPNDGAAPEDARLYFFPNQPGAVPDTLFGRVTVEWLDSARRVIELRSLVPFEAEVQSRNAALLETPKLFIPGYRATVNGEPAPIERTGEGFVGVIVPAGRSVVRLDYPGGLLLRCAFWASALGWLAFISAFSLDTVNPWMSKGASCEEAVLQWLRRWGVLTVLTAAIACAAPFLWRRFVSPPRGALLLVLEVPWATPGAAEPLLTTGHAGAGDVIYLTYLGAGRFTVGHDRWGTGGDISKPFAVDPSQPQTVRIAMASLGAGPGVHVWWNGREVISENHESFPLAPPSEIEVGANEIGGTACGTQFTGRILKSSRVASDPAATP
jgi:hypothetical protein